MGFAKTSPSETRQRILDAAGILFSEMGFRSVSLRQITQEAKVNLAAVNYHFGSKDALIAELLAQVIAPINRERLRLLTAAEERHAPGPVPVAEILESFHRPVVNQLRESAHQTSVYLKLAGRCLAEPADNFSDTLVSLFREEIARYLAAIGRALPELEESTIFWRMHFSFGTMVYSLTHGDRVAMFSEGRVSAGNPEDILQRLIAFTAAGLMAGPDPLPRPGESPTIVLAGTDTIDRPKPGRSRSRAGALLPSLAALALLTGFTGCRSLSPPDAKHHAHVQAPSHWIAGADYRPAHLPDRHWTERFGDAGLNRWIEAVVENNHDLKAAQSRIEIASATSRITGADLYPQIQGALSGQRSQQNFIGFPFGDEAGGGASPVLSSTSNQFGLSLDLSWELDLWGRIRAATAATVADFEASIFDYEAARLSLAGQAAKSWFALAEARDQVALTEATIRTFSETESLLRNRFETGVEENGRNFASELLLAEAEVARAREDLNARLELVQRTSRQLEVLVGKYPAGRAGNEARLPNFPGPVPAGLPATLLERRPDLAAAERRLAASDERFLEARRSLLPAISLTSRVGTSSEDIGDILNGDFSIWSVAGNLAQPVLQGGRLRANVTRREAELQLAATEFEQAALTAFSEVENALAAERFFSKRIDALVQASRLTREAYLRSREEFENGTGDILTVFSAQERDFASRSQLLALRRLRLDNRIDLHLALGGDFRAHETPAAKDSHSG